VETRIALLTEGDSLLVRHLQPVNRINSRICWSLVCDVAHELAMPAKNMPPKKSTKRRQPICSLCGVHRRCPSVGF
jgi:hypothetical protein